MRCTKDSVTLATYNSRNGKCWPDETTRVYTATGCNEIRVPSNLMGPGYTMRFYVKILPKEKTTPANETAEEEADPVFQYDHVKNAPASHFKYLPFYEIVKNYTQCSVGSVECYSDADCTESVDCLENFQTMLADVYDEFAKWTSTGNYTCDKSGVEFACTERGQEVRFFDTTKPIKYEDGKCVGTLLTRAPEVMTKLQKKMFKGQYLLSHEDVAVCQPNVIST